MRPASRCAAHWWDSCDETANDQRFLAEVAAGRSVAVPLGDYVINAAVADRSGNLRWGSETLPLRATGKATATIRLSHTIPAVRPQAAVGETFQGAEVMLDVEGFWQPNATVDLVWRGPKPTHRNIDDPDDDIATMPPTIRERPFPLTLPAKVGPYEARYTLCAPRLVLARWPLRVKRAEITLDAPARAKTATEIEVVMAGMLAKAQRLHLRDAAGEDVEAAIARAGGYFANAAAHAVCRRPLRAGDPDTGRARAAGAADDRR